MTNIKRPALIVQMPVKVFREKEDGQVGIFYSQTIGTIYRWEPRKVPSGLVMWEVSETNRTAQEFTELLLDHIPDTLYESLKLFYIGGSDSTVCRDA
jgi:hypothetical protein